MSLSLATKGVLCPKQPNGLATRGVLCIDLETIAAIAAKQLKLLGYVYANNPLCAEMVLGAGLSTIGSVFADNPLCGRVKEEKPMSGSITASNPLCGRLKEDP